MTASPPAVIRVMPCAPFVLATTVKVSPSGSSSFAPTASSVAAAPSGTEKVTSLTAFGARLAPVMLTVTVAVSVPPLPSLIV